MLEGNRLQLFGIFLGEELQKPLGADAHPAREQALEVELAHPDAAGNFLQAGLLGEILFQEEDGLLHPSVVRR